MGESRQIANTGNEERPLFSIAVPVYNAQDCLCDTIVSIERQACSDWELIIVDDASTDQSARIAEELAESDRRIRVIRHAENRWASAARNTGIEAARGRYLWMPDADDTFDPGLLEACRASLEDNPADVVVFGHTERHLDAKGDLLFETRIVPPAARCETPEELHPLIAELEYLSCYGYPWNKVYRLDLLRETGVRFGRGEFIEDIVFNAEFFDHVRSMNVIARPLYGYAVREEGNLTAALFEKGYYEKNRHRTQLIRDQLEGWGVLDDDAKARLGNLYGRYILSALERNCDSASGMGRAEREAWLRGVFADPLFDELIPHAEAEEGSALATALIPLKDRRLKGTLRMAGLIHFAKGRFGTQLNKLRSQR